MASTDAKPFPIKNTAYRVYFPILDADGDLVTGAATLDSERSLDGAAFADCTNEATEIATSSGVYYLDLTAAEMNTDCTVVIVKTSTVGAKTTVLTLYPVEAGDIGVDVTAWNGTAVATPGTAGIPEVNIKNIANAAVSTSTAQLGVNAVQAGGTAWGSGAVTAAAIADGAIDAATFAAGAINAAAIAADAITAAKVAADVGAEIAGAVWNEDATAHQTQGSFGQAIGDPVSDTNTLYKAVVTDATGATVGVDVVALKAETVTILADTDNIQTRLPAALVSGRMDSSIGAVASGVIAAGSFAAGALDAVWSTTTRILTAGTNIVLAKGTGVTGFNDISSAQVNAEVVDGLNVDTYAEPGQGAPGATISLAAKINYLYKAWRNKKTQTATLYTLFNDAETVADQKATHSDDGTTYTSGEIVTGL